MKKLLLMQDEDGRRMEEKVVLYKFGSKLEGTMTLVATGLQLWIHEVMYFVGSSKG